MGLGIQVQSLVLELQGLYIEKVNKFLRCSCLSHSTWDIFSHYFNLCPLSPSPLLPYCSTGLPHPFCFLPTFLPQLRSLRAWLL